MPSLQKQFKLSVKRVDEITVIGNERVNMSILDATREIFNDKRLSDDEKIILLLTSGSSLELERQKQLKE